MFESIDIHKMDIEAEIAEFLLWQRQENRLDRLQLLRENAAIAYAAAEHGIASRAAIRPVLSSPTGRFSRSEVEMQCNDRHGNDMSRKSQR